MPDLATLALRNAGQARAARRQVAALPPRRRTAHDFRHLADLTLDPVAAAELAWNAPVAAPNPATQRMWAQAFARVNPGETHRKPTPAARSTTGTGPRSTDAAALWDRAIARI